jgi:hypothetical protein
MKERTGHKEHSKRKRKGGADSTISKVANTNTCIGWHHSCSSRARINPTTKPETLNPKPQTHKPKNPKAYIPNPQSPNP